MNVKLLSSLYKKTQISRKETRKDFTIQKRAFKLVSKIVVLKYFAKFIKNSTGVFFNKITVLPPGSVLKNLDTCFTVIFAKCLKEHVSDYF